MYGMATMVMYGPTSIYRTATAPVTVYSRGYDGQVVELRGHSFSSPMMPESNPVVYPTTNSYYYRPRSGSSRPWTTTGYNWMDHN
jgi:hypothetical protein